MINHCLIMVHLHVADVLHEIRMILSDLLSVHFQIFLFAADHFSVMMDHFFAQLIHDLFFCSYFHPSSYLIIVLTVLIRS